MADDRKRGLTPEQRADAKVAFEGGESLRAIAKRIPCRYATLHAIREREAWTVSPTVSLSGPGELAKMKARVESKVVDLKTREAIEQLESSGLVDAIADEIIATQTAKLLASQIMIDVFQKLRDGKIKPAEHQGQQTEVDVAHRAMGMYRIFSSTIREDAGLKPGQATSSASEALAKKPQRIRLVVVPPPLPKAINE